MSPTAQQHSEVEASAATPRRLFLDHLDLVERVIGYVCRRHHLSEEEGEEFGGAVRLKLVEGDYGVIASFEGRSSLPTYLTTVVNRFFLDWLRAQKGRPRPSAAARRYGVVAIQLERLLHWQGFSFDEACRILQENHGVDASWQELEEVAGHLPPRVLERRHEGGDAPDRLVAGAQRPDEAALEHEREEEAARTVATLEEVLTGLDPEDRVILKMRFEDGFKVSEVASALGLPQKPLYRRIGKLLARLRHELEARGLEQAGGWWT